MSSSLRIIVTGLIAQHPRIGGISWHYLQYLLGLTRLGHDVYYYEDSGEYPYDLDVPASAARHRAASSAFNVARLAEIMNHFGLQGKWAYHCTPESTWYGLSEGKRREVLGSADLVLNVSGTLRRPTEYREVPRLVYIDTDPVITQIKIALGKARFIERVDLHDVHFSFGERLSQDFPESTPRWRPTRQPIVLSEWRPLTPFRNRFTTIMSWTSYEPLVHGGLTYGQKDIEFKRFLELPARLGDVALEVALGSREHPNWEARTAHESEVPESGAGGRARTPRELLEAAGWQIADALDACGDPHRYRGYIESSKAEWSVAKNAYVQGQPGWFSERSACYLAAGRPTVVQDTGFTGSLPVGAGILPFRTVEEAVDAVHDVEANYARHAEAARAIAETHFDSDKVLSGLLDEATTVDRRSAAPSAAARANEPRSARP